MRTNIENFTTGSTVGSTILEGSFGTKDQLTKPL